MEGLAVVGVVAIGAQQPRALMFGGLPAEQAAMTGRVTIEAGLVRGISDERRVRDILDVKSAGAVAALAVEMVLGCGLMTVAGHAAASPERFSGACDRGRLSIRRAFHRGPPVGARQDQSETE